MDTLNYELLVRILIAHFLSDFIFQRKDWALEKDVIGIRSRFFWLHIAIHAITLTVLVWDLGLWPVILWVTMGHLIIDAIKSRIPNSDKWVFIGDQLSHILVIVTVWLIFSQQWELFCRSVDVWMNNQKLWWLVLTYLLITKPASVLIDKVTQKWSKEMANNGNQSGLENAGNWIGVMERFLIITFIITANISAIGFLLAAKSVFRFGDLQEASAHKKTEYIIIGTLLSFSIAIIIGLIYKFVM